MKKALVLGGLVALAAAAVWIARSPDNERADQSNRRRRVDRLLYSEGLGAIPEQ